MKMLKAKEAKVNRMPERGIHRPAPQKTGKQITYPDSDGKRMSDNTLHFEWIVKIKMNLEWLFKNDPNVFIAGDLLWYPVEGNNKIRTAPDAMVAFGRSKGHRGSYRTWEENDIAPQVVFEIMSPLSKRAEMVMKFRFYQRYGVEEYYQYNPHQIRLKGWLRTGNNLMPIPDMQGWISPLLKIRFDLSTNDLVIYYPDGGRFVSLSKPYRMVKANDQRTDAERMRAEAAIRRAEYERKKAEAEYQRAESERREKERLAAMLRKLGVDI